MPKHVVHAYLAEKFYGIPLNVMRDVNRFIDIVREYEGWSLGSGDTTILAMVVYEKWGYYGLKAALHHHLLDCTETLAIDVPREFIVKELAVCYILAKYVSRCNIDAGSADLLEVLKRVLDVSRIKEH